MADPYTPPEYTDAVNTFEGINVGVSTPPANFNITQLTEGTPEGNGVFDVLMRVAKAHLDEEYRATRITGKEYATVYMSLYASTIQAAGLFLVQHREAEKVVAEAGLLRQRTQTELAQTSDNLSLTLAFNTNSDVKGLVKKQMLDYDKKGLVQDAQISLYGKQEDGFDRDAEQKLAKIVVDAWSVQRTTDEATTVAGTGLDNAGIGSIIAKAKDGIGA